MSGPAYRGGQTPTGVSPRAGSVAVSNVHRGSGARGGLGSDSELDIGLGAGIVQELPDGRVGLHPCRWRERLELVQKHEQRTGRVTAVVGSLQPQKATTGHDPCQSSLIGAAELRVHPGGHDACTGQREHLLSIGKRWGVGALVQVGESDCSHGLEAPCGEGLWGIVWIGHARTS